VLAPNASYFLEHPLAFVGQMECILPAVIGIGMSSLSLITYPANFAIPITRFVGIVWLILVGVRLPATRGGTKGAPGEAATA